MENVQRKERILAIDALRGFAVMGIILLHNIEHFNFYSFPEPSSPALAHLDKTLWDMLFFLFSGKAYAIFALLFGFTFYLQSRSAAKRGEDFKGRYMWRLVLLLGFGFVNSLFFPGEILVLYAILGFILVPVRHWKNQSLLILSVILMLQPVEWIKVVCGWLSPDYAPRQMIFSLGDVYPQLGGDSWWEMVKMNFTIGQLASLNWAWCYGRVFQTCALFVLGLWIGRMGYFDSSSETALGRSRNFWTYVLCFSLPLAVGFYFVKTFVFSLVSQPLMLDSLKTILNSWYNFCFMLTLCIPVALLDGEGQDTEDSGALWKNEPYRLHHAVGHWEFPVFRLRTGFAPILRYDSQSVCGYRFLPVAVGFCPLVVPPFQARTVGNPLAQTYLDGDP